MSIITISLDEPGHVYVFYVTVPITQFIAGYVQSDQRCS